MLYNIVVVFAIHLHESAMGVYVSPILKPQPPGLSQCAGFECPVSGHAHFMESLNIKEHLRECQEKLTYRIASVSISLICSLLLFSVSVLFYVGSLGKRHIEPIQGMKC